MARTAKKMKMDDKQTWIGVDFDGTLAYYDGWKGPEREHMGEPVPRMMERVRQWLEDGIHVKIFTARAAQPSQIPAVKQWLKDYDLPDLEVTCKKDFFMGEIWDDRAVQVESNTGLPVQEKLSLMLSFGR